MDSHSTYPALIPAAGRGTRLRPITSYISKPMLPLGDQPVVHWVIEEALRADCRPVVVVVNPEDENLKGYIEKTFSQQVQAVEQPRPLGLAHALLVGYEYLSVNKPVAMLLADNIILDSGGMKYILERKQDEWLTFGTVEVSKEEAEFYGNSGGYKGKQTGEAAGEIEEVVSLQEKKEGSFSEANRSWPARRTVGRALLPPEFFQITRRMKPDPSSGELDDVPVYRQLIEKNPATGILLPRTVYDMGQPERYLRLCGACFKRKHPKGSRK